MSHTSTMVDMPSPTGSLSHIFVDGDYPSEPQSPIISAYNLPYTNDLSSISSVYPSPEAEDEPSQLAQEQKSGPKRKRENRYKNAPPSVLSRRRAQNRASQRAYRERKDKRIKDLEQMLTEAKQRNDVLGQAFVNLQAEYMQLKTERAPGFQQPQQHPSNLSFALPGLAMTAGSGSELLDMDLFVYPDMTSPGYTMT